jgi:predicted DNA-binding transcriptional regulator YafY
METLKTEYDMTADRKAIRRNLDNLMQMGYAIEYSETVRMTVNPKTGEPEENVILSDFYLEREITDSELRLLIDGLLFSKHLPYSQCRELVGKLEGLSSSYFRSHIRHIHTMPEMALQNPQLFYTIEVLDEAIGRGRKVAFSYLEYSTDKKRRPKRRSDGSVREYVVSPYQMAATEGKYYLICNYDKYNDISNYRIERIANIRMLDEAAKPFETLQGSDGRRLDLAKYMAEHIYMYSSDSARVVFRIVKPMITDVIDLFGMDVSFSDETDTHVTVTARVNEMAMEQFAKSYAPDVIVLEPQRIADAVRRDAERTIEAYKEENNT